MRSRIGKLVAVIVALAGIFIAAVQLIRGAGDAPPLMLPVETAGPPLSMLTRDLAFASDRLLVLEPSPGGERVLEVDLRTRAVTMAVAAGTADRPFVSVFWRPRHLLVVATAKQVFISGPTPRFARTLPPLPEHDLEIVAVSEGYSGFEVMVVRAEQTLGADASPLSRRTVRLADAKIAHWTETGWSLRPFVPAECVMATEEVCRAEFGTDVTIDRWKCELCADELGGIVLSPASAHVYSWSGEWFVDVIRADWHADDAPAFSVSRFSDLPDRVAQRFEISATAKEVTLRWPWLAGGLGTGVQVQLELEALLNRPLRGLVDGTGTPAAISFEAIRLARSHPTVPPWPARLYAAFDPNWDWLWYPPFILRVDAATGTALDQPNPLERLAHFVFHGEGPGRKDPRVSLVGSAMLRATPAIVFVVPLIPLLLLCAWVFRRRPAYQGAIRNFEFPLWMVGTLMFSALWGLFFAHDVVLRL